MTATIILANRRMPTGTYWWCEWTGKELILTFQLDFVTNVLMIPQVIVDAVE